MRKESPKEERNNTDCKDKVPPVNAIVQQFDYGLGGAVDRRVAACMKEDIWVRFPVGPPAERQQK